MIKRTGATSIASHRPRSVAAALVLGIAAATSSTHAASSGPDFDRMAVEVRKLLGELVEANTTNPPGNEAKAARIGAARLRAAGIEPFSGEFAPGRENLVARLKGSGRERPMILLAHIDVVGAEGQPWSVDPHVVTEKDGYLYGRGVSDDLGMAAMELVVFLALRDAGVRLDRDVILAWTGDEESGGKGIRHLIDTQPDLVDAAIALNEGGGPILVSGDGRAGSSVSHISLQTAEKTYQDYVLTTTGPTGHSSVPLADNAIVRLSAALARIGGHAFPDRVLPTVRSYYEGRVRIEKGGDAEVFREIAASAGALPPRVQRTWLDEHPIEAANLRTTCVATLVSGGTRENALPASASANVNCRILPDETPEQVRQELERIVADPKVQVKIEEDNGFGPSSPFEGAVVETIKTVAGQQWGAVPVIPFMSRGATDSRFLRKRGTLSYGLRPYPMTEEDGRRHHGVDERIPAASVRPGVEFLYRLVVALATDQKAAPKRP
jgi:acetylornithine deacetylase/succinyl-diaminopimelate desuccinylase-like protein